VRGAFGRNLVGCGVFLAALVVGCHDWAPEGDAADTPVESSGDADGFEALRDDASEASDETARDPGAEADDAALEADAGGDVGEDVAEDVSEDVGEDAGATCGNGRLEPGEECELGSVVPCTTRCGTGSSGECRRDCRLPAADECPVQAETCNGIDDDCSGTPDDGSGACPGCMVSSYGGHVYHLCTSLVTWLEAQSTCAGRGLHLVTIDDAAEDDWLLAVAQSVSSGTWWIGINDQAEEGTWGWVGPPSTYVNWCAGEPNDSGGIEDCGEFAFPCSDATDIAWNDSNCTRLKAFVCEYP